MNEENEEINPKKITKDENSTTEFYTLSPNDYPKYSYSFTNPLYNSHPNYNDNPVINRKYIGQFILGEKLGQGTFGIVVLAKHQITGEKVAIKILDKEKIIQEADKTRIEREIKILKNLRHNNIVHLYDIKETSNSLYIIMEYIQGKELFDYIVSKKRLSEIEACNFYQQIISGIEYLGKIRVVHRDIKPENLLLDNKNKIKIVDFGLSNIYPNNELLQTACGSPCYAAPEMINGELYKGLGADIWSSGIVLYAMLCGYLPFEDGDNEILYKKITDGKFKTPKYLSENCKDFLHKILNVDPKKRYTIKQIKKHPWFNLINPRINLSEGLLLNVYIVPIDEKIVEEMATKYKFNEDIVRANLISNKHNHTTTTYYLLLMKKIREGKKSVADLKSKEFLNYISNPVNLLSTYGNDLNMIIQIRNSLKNKDNINNNLFNNYKTNCDINMTKKNKYDKQISEGKILYGKEKEKSEEENKAKDKKNDDKIIIEVNGDNNNIYKNEEKFKKFNTKNESTKETLNYNNDSLSNNLNNDNKNTLFLNKKIYENSLFQTKKESKKKNNNIKESNYNKNNIRDKSFEINNNNDNYKYLVKKLNKEKQKRTITNNNSVTQRKEKTYKISKKKYKIIESRNQKDFKIIKEKKTIDKNLEEDGIKINNEKKYKKITDLIKKTKIIEIKKEKNENNRSFDDNISNNQLKYLLTEKLTKDDITIETNLNEENETFKNNNFNSTINETTKLAQKILNLNSYQKNKAKDKIKIKHLLLKSKIGNNERNPKVLGCIRNNKIRSKRRFIDTSVSFDRSRGLTEDKINKKKNDKNIKPINPGNEKIKDNDKDINYLKLKSKNKKFRVIKIDENSVKDKFNSINVDIKNKNLLDQNNLEQINHPLKNNILLSERNDDNKTNIIISEDISSLRIKRNQYKKLKESIKKVSLNKKHLLTLLNEPKNNIFPKKIKDSNINDKFKTFNNDNCITNENNSFQTNINQKNKVILSFKSKLDKKFFSTNYENNNINNKEKNNNIKINKEYIPPFDLCSIFINKADKLKEKIVKEGENKKWKNRIKKKDVIMSKNEEQINFMINEINNNKKTKIYIIKALKKEGNIQKCKAFIKNIIYKLK